jgi:hypothetical protein
MGKDPKQTLAARQRVRGTSPLTLRSTMGVSRNLSRALRVPSGWPPATLDRTRPTGACSTAADDDHQDHAPEMPPTVRHEPTPATIGNL